jgi:hypothetical protein
MGWSVAELVFGAAVLGYFACGAATEVGLLVAHVTAGDQTIGDIERDW